MFRYTVNVLQETLDILARWFLWFVSGTAFIALFFYIILVAIPQ